MAKKPLSLVMAFLFLMVWINDAVAGCSSWDQVDREHKKTRREIQTVKDKIEWVGSLLQMEIRSQTVSIEKMFEMQNQFLEDVMKGIAYAQEEAIIERTYGDKSIPKTGCSGKDLSALRNQVESKLNLKTLKEAKTNTIGNSNSHEMNNAIDTMLKTAPQGSHKLMEILYADTIPENDQKKALDALIYMTDRIPPRKLTRPEIARGIVATEYERVRKIRNFKMAVPQKVIADHITSRLPTLQLEDWATKQWENMGGVGDVPGLVNGEISSTTLVNFFVDSRIANPNWLSVDVMEMNAVGLARESILMQAAEMFMARKQNNLLEQIALMLALQLSDSIANETGLALHKLETQLGND